MKRSNISDGMAMALPSQAAICEQRVCEVKEWHRKESGKEHSRLFRMIGNHLVIFLSFLGSVLERLYNLFK